MSVARVVPDDVSLASTSTTAPLAARARRWLSLVPCPPSSRAISRRASPSSSSPSSRRARRVASASISSGPSPRLHAVVIASRARDRRRIGSERKRLDRARRSRRRLARRVDVEARRRARARPRALRAKQLRTLLFLAPTRVRIGDATTRVDLSVQPECSTRVFVASPRRARAFVAGEEREARAREIFA